MTAQAQQAAAERTWFHANQRAEDAEAAAKRWGCPRNSDAADWRREEQQAWAAVEAARARVAH